MTAQLERAAFRALGTTAEVIVDRPEVLDEAQSALSDLLDAVDSVASRFRPDAELAFVASQAGRPVRVSWLLGELIAVALRAAAQTEGAVDPTVGASMVDLGYDRDFDELAGDDQPVAGVPAPGWRTVGWDASRREVTIPAGVILDLGATAKAWAADAAAARINSVTRAGVLVSLGGDVAVAGPAPAEGWPIHVGDDHKDRDNRDGDTIALMSGGLATSSTSVRRWRRGGREIHHIVDPETGEPADLVWRTVSVVAARAVDANTASTAAIVMGQSAPSWLGRLGLAARVVSPNGEVVRIGAWP